MDAEIENLIRVWIWATASACYCYFIVKPLPKGLPRLLFLLPVVFLFITLPLSLRSVNLGAPTIFYLVWLGNFKLLLFSFDEGPLSSSHNLPLFQFISIALLPIKPKSQPADPKINKTPDPISQNYALSAVKLALLAINIRLYTYRENIHPYIIFVLYCTHLYLGVELFLALTAGPIRALLGLEIEPQFNEPYLATSLQDFWGRRWNLMVTSILRPTVYDPIRRISTRILGRSWAFTLASLATFLVSGLIHEAIFYYMTRVRPTWEVTWFFVLQGVCLGAEVAVKRAVKGGGWRLPGVVSAPLTVAFVCVTAAWLFFPQIIRNGIDRKAIEEYYVLINFVRDELLHISSLSRKVT